jgi:hypothetical protein
MSPGPSRAATALERSAASAAGRLDLDDARGALARRQAYLPRRTVKAATARPTALTTRLN